MAIIIGESSLPFYLSRENLGIAPVFVLKNFLTLFIADAGSDAVPAHMGFEYQSLTNVSSPKFPRASFFSSFLLSI